MFSEAEIVSMSVEDRKKNNKILTCKNVFSITPWVSFNLIYYTRKKDSVGLNKRYFTATILKVSDKTTLKRCLVFYHFVAIMYFRTHLTKAQQFGIPLDNMIIEEFRQCFT